MGDDVAQYLTRKQREIALLDACLDPPLALAAPASIDDVIDVKRKLAGAVRAQRSLASWEVTETAQPAERRMAKRRVHVLVRLPARRPRNSRAADLSDAGREGHAVETLYTCAGMGAAAALFTALGQYSDRCRCTWRARRTRKRASCWSALRSACAARVVAVAPHARPRPRRARPARRLGDGGHSARRRSDAARHRARRFRHDLLLADVGPHRARRALGAQARRAGRDVPQPQQARQLRRRVRKARLDRAVVAPAKRGALDARRVRETRDTIRLLGVAAIPAHLPPFTDDDAYVLASGERTAA